MPVKLPTILKRLGRGFVTGPSDDDPAGIGTYIQSGAQAMSGRIRLVTGQGLAAVIRNNYPRPLLLFVIATQVLTNTVSIGADLSAMAESAQLLWHVPFYALLALTTVVTVALIVLVSYRALQPSFLTFAGTKISS